jgi:hypothetical protein
LGELDLDADSDPTRFCQARERATAADMLGMLASINLRIIETIGNRNGPVATPFMRHLLHTIIGPSLYGLALRPPWAGCARPTPFAVRLANARSNTGFVTT